MAANASVVVDFKAVDKQYTSTVKKMANSLDDLGDELADLKGKFSKGEISVDAFEKELKSLESRQKSTIRSMKSFGAEIQNTNRHLFKSTGGKRGKGSGSSNAGLAIQELGRGVADFNAAGGFRDVNQGLRGATNNLERFAEIAIDLGRKGGGLKGVMKGIGQSLVGPGGLILAITLLLQLMPKLIQAFKDGAFSGDKFAKQINKNKTEIEKLKKAADDASDSLLKLALNTEADKLAAATLDLEIKALEARAESNKLAGKIFLNGTHLNNEDKKNLDLKKEQLDTLNKTIKANEEYINSETKFAGAQKDKLRDLRVQLALAQSNGLSELETLQLKLKINDVEGTIAKDAKTVNKLYEQRLVLLGLINAEKNKEVLAGEGASAGFDRFTGGGEFGRFTNTGSGGLGVQGLVDLPSTQFGAQSDFSSLGQQRGEFSLGLSTASSEIKTEVPKIEKGFNTISYAASAAASVVGQLTAALAGPDASTMERVAASIVGTLASIAIGAAVASATQSAAGTGPAAIFTLPTFIAIALGAVGAALSGVKGASGVGGGGSSYSHASAPSPVDPVFTQDGGTGSGQVGSVRGNNLMLAIQVAQDRRNGQTGSYSFG